MGVLEECGGGGGNRFPVEWRRRGLTGFLFSS